MNILFICTHNRCRSILAEAITNHLGAGRLRAFSAGSTPAGAVHPLTLMYLAAAGIPIQGLASKSWDIFAGSNPDLVITLCDSAAAEGCPAWMGSCPRLHWGLADPSKMQGNDAATEQAFKNCIALIGARTRALLELQARFSGGQLIEAISALAKGAAAEAV